jgi:formylglycine-generating enzyme required for sulfatase activity
MFVLHVLVMAVMLVVSVGATAQAQQAKPSTRKPEASRPASGQPKTAQQLFYDAFEAYKANRFKEAIAQFEKGLQQEPTNALAAFYLGEAYAKSGDQAKAQKWYAASVAADPQSEVAGQARERLAAAGGVSPQAPTAPKTLRNSIGMEFVLIPAGTFQMGSDDSEAYNNERPAHTVRITQPFYLGKYEVTQGQWQAVMGSNPSRFTGDPNRPVEQVSWEDVQEFIRRLNAREGGATYHLPTEAEWEYAARAGTTSRWSFGDTARQLGRYGWYEENAGGQTHPVGQLQPNPWGLYDMHGNVWEWVQDWYAEDYYRRGTAVDPAGPSSGSSRVHRGGG